MATGKKIENRSHIIGFKEEIQKAGESSKDSFFTWFDTAKDTNSSFIRGFWDFSVHFAHPVAKYISNPETKTALEIGYGGGRILAAAANHFQYVIGTDLHEHLDIVKNELNTRGIHNFELHVTDGTSIPINDWSVDLVYSFIVFQHLEKMEIFLKYFEETYRVLKQGGIAVLYFGRFRQFSNNRGKKYLYLLDRLIERFVLREGFREIPARVNETNLIVTLNYAMKSAKALNFEICEVLVSKKKVPDGFKYYGGQHGLILKKNMD